MNITLEQELRDAYIAQGNDISFDDWLRHMADNDEGTLQFAAAKLLEKQHQESRPLQPAAAKFFEERRLARRPTIFPFTLPAQDGNTLFQAYVQTHRQHLNETYGDMVSDGRSRYKSWSYYEVDVEILSETALHFTTYGVKHPNYGGRGAKQEVIPATLKPGQLAKYIEAEKMRIAADTYRAQRAAAEAAAEIESIDAVYKEMFS